ncbi:hypothetical protein FQR65_LT08424 [Abscondita terminalis]|nr:hypothetical protein FQR65_LT08424 [Abscondita terminalis]
MSKKELVRKHREDQEATAHAFQEFIKTFQDTSGPPNKTFVKSGIFNVKTGQEIESHKREIYNPRPVIKMNSCVIMKNAIECARLLKETKLERIKGQEKPKTNLEILKEELKLRHIERKERIKLKENLTMYSASNVGENVDPTTTNLFIAHVNVKTTESDLMKLFGSYGPLASVKIMWPRIDERNRTTNCGFVAFMSRKDAERAMCHLKDLDDMRIGWGKAVEIPSHPIYIPPDLLKLSLPPPHTGFPFNAQPLQHQSENPTTEIEIQNLLYSSVVQVTIPIDKKVLMSVHRTIEFVIREGPLFEAMIMNKEIHNPTYQFLFDNRKPEHIYYRWKLYSMMHGETYKKWSTKKFRMFKNGSLWIPPIVYDYTKGMPDNLNNSVKVDKSMLSDAQKNRFIQLIQTLNMSKRKIGEAMVFCLNHVDAAKDVIDVIIDSFMNDSTKATKKIARLYLLSDVLFNSNIFKRLEITLKNLHLPSDIEAFKYRVLNVLRSWDLWKIYPKHSLNNLENTFLNVIETELEEGNSECDEPLDGANLIKRSMKNRFECVDKEEPRYFQQDLVTAGFIPSKWELVDPDQVEAQAMSTKKFYAMELERQMKEKNISEHTNTPINKELKEEDRDMLRKVEIIVMHYQDDFENGKRKLENGKSLDHELNSLRDHLLQKMKKNKEDNYKKRRVSPSISEHCSDGDDKENHVKRKKYKKRIEKLRYDNKGRKRLHKE